MNPYQPPQCTEPVAVTGEAPLMQVTYGLQYSLLFFFSGFVMLGVAILMAMTMEAGVKIVVLPAGAGVSNVAIAVLCLGRVYFEVFEDRIEFISPVFTKWRRARPLTVMDNFTLHAHRFVARGEDMKRFIAWREGSLR